MTKTASKMESRTAPNMPRTARTAPPGDVPQTPRMNWDQFSFDYRLELDSPSLFRYFINIEAYKEASLNLVLPPEWRMQLDRLNRARQIYGTTALEGSPLSETEVLRQLDLFDNEKPLPATVKIHAQTRNASVAQEWVRSRFVPGSPPVRCEDLLEMHRLLTEKSDMEHNIPGRWRTFSVTVGSPELGGVHRGAPHERLPGLMGEYIGFLASRRLQQVHPVVKALLAHFFLVTIHPFGDGNGRVSRLLEAGILFQEAYNVHGFYGLSNYFYQHEHRYKTVLQECRRTIPFEVTPFVQFGIEGFATELKEINNFIKTKLNRVVYRTMLTGNSGSVVGKHGPSGARAAVISPVSAGGGLVIGSL